MILQMPHSFRWGDRAGVGISKIFAESVYPHARIEQRIYKKSPEGLTDFGKVLRALFFSPESVFKRVAQNNETN